MSEDWYVYKNQVQQGPYTWSQLHKEAQSGRLMPEDLVWNQALENWVPASQVPGLIAQVGQAAQTSQPPMPAPLSPPDAPAPSEGRGLLVAFIAALVVFLVLSGYTVYHFFFSDRDQTATETTTLAETTTTLATTTTTTTAPPTTTTAQPTTTTAATTTTTATTTTATTTTTAPGTTQTTTATWWIID
jgi:heme/copper-type cytochrome/quinol oxidase subunit 2